MFISPIIMEDFLSRKKLPVSKHSSHLRKLRCSLNASKSFFTFSAACGSKLQGDRQVKMLRAEKKRRSLFEFYDSAELIFLGFCEKKSMGILPNSRFQDFQTGIVSAKMITFGPSTPVIMGTNNRYTLVNMAKNH